VVGAFSFATSLQTNRTYGPVDLAFAQDLARRAAASLDNARLYQEAQQANQIKDEFLAVVSHELRTPLNAILGWTQLLRRGKLKGDAPGRALEVIERNARSQNQLIEDLLDVSRIVAGKLKLDIRPVGLVSVLEAALDVVRLAAQAKSLELETHFAPTGLVLGDANRLQQVFWNLLSNAVKFTPNSGKVTLRLFQSTFHATVIVHDTGGGIAEDLLPHIFERFLQGNSSIGRSYNGLGLGLAIVRNLVELHGGTISVKNQDLGALFTVNLPLAGPYLPEDAP
jgi:signal transduction histidine kinase